MNDFSMEELLCLDSPYLSMNDMLKQDWIELDYALEKYDMEKKKYVLSDLPVLVFVLQQIHLDKDNFLKVPNFIRISPCFQELAILSNPDLKSTLFPETHITNKLYIVEIGGFAFHDISAIDENEALSSAWKKLNGLNIEHYSTYEKERQTALLTRGFKQFYSDAKLTLKENYIEKL